MNTGIDGVSAEALAAFIVIVSAMSCLFGILGGQIGRSLRGDGNTGAALGFFLWVVGLVIILGIQDRRPRCRDCGGIVVRGAKRCRCCGVVII